MRDKKWDMRFLALAKLVSSWSKDGSTQVGAVICDSDHRIISVGYNGLAVGLKDEKLNENRDRKLKTIIHAEINAILFAENKDLKGSTLYTWPMMPCSNCSSVIIQKKIARCVFPKASPERQARWEESFRVATEQFTEVGILLDEYESDLFL
jgi:dCMP deaminase